MKVQKEKMIAVIEAEQRLLDAALTELCATPGHCAMGALLFAAGASNEFLQALDDDDDGLGWSADHEARSILRDRYGLTKDLGMRIETANDANYGIDNSDLGIAERRRRVLTVIRSLPDELPDVA